jgi:hypothetical protein
MAGQTVAMLTSITAITNATAVLIIEVDVLNRILVGNIFRSPKDKCIKEQPPAAYNRKHATTKPV